jgi:rRNA-processing protein FCF1
MQVLSLIKKEKPNFNFPKLGVELGYGADGQVFELIDDPNKVIKYSVIFDWNSLPSPAKSKINIKEKFSKLKNNLEIIKNNYHEHSFMVKIFNHEFLFQGKRKIVNNEDQDYLIHSLIMEKLKEISDDENKVFHSLLYHKNVFWEKDFSDQELDETLFGLAKGLDFNHSKVKSFYKKVKKSTIQHNDINLGNIMKNVDGDYKLIDLDRLSKKEE